MEQRPLDITIISAKGLKDVGAFSKMDVYVAVSLSTNPGSEQKTPVDEDGGSKPKWNHLVRFTVDEPSIQMNRAVVVFKLRHERKLMGDKDVGEVHVAVKELLEKAGAEKGHAEVEYSVKSSSGKEKGSLKFSYKFGEVFKIENTAYAPQHASQKMVDPYGQPAPGYYPPPVGYPAHGASGSYAPPPAYAAPYAAPPGGYPQGGPPVGYPQGPPGGYPQGPPGGYPQGPPGGYSQGPPGGYSQGPPGGYPYGGGYHQQQPGGYPPMGYQGGYQKPQKPKKGGGMGGGAGLGLGLAGGLIGGMIVGDMIDDAFDDGGDF